MNAEYAKGSQDYSHLQAGAAAQQLNAKTQTPIRERLQEVNKRVDGIASSLSFLLTTVVYSPPSTLAGITDATAKDSTLTGEMDSLQRTVANIENDLQRLSTAITG